MYSSHAYFIFISCLLGFVISCYSRSDLEFVLNKKKKIKSSIYKVMLNLLSKLRFLLHLSKLMFDIDIAFLFFFPMLATISNFQKIIFHDKIRCWSYCCGQDYPYIYQNFDNVWHWCDDFFPKWTLDECKSICQICFHVIKASIKITNTLKRTFFLLLS